MVTFYSHQINKLKIESLEIIKNNNLKINIIVFDKNWLLLERYGFSEEENFEIERDIKLFKEFNFQKLKSTDFGRFSVIARTIDKKSDLKKLIELIK